MIFKNNLFIFFLFLAFCIVSCKNFSKKKNENNEGVVSYKISYPQNNPYKSVRMLPTETNLVFKDTKASFITSGGMGLISIVNILDNDNRRFTSLLLNGLGENYAFIDTPEDVKEQETNPLYKIKTTDETKIIAGVECRKAIVNDITNKTKFDIYYCDKIKMCYGDGPFKDFSYLMMDYSHTKYGLPMHLEAVKIDLNPVDTSLLNVHGDFIWVNRKTFFSIVENLKVPI